MMKDMIESGKIPGLGKEGKGGGKRRKGKDGDDDDGGKGGKNGPTSDDPNFRPEKSEEVPGITDQRWEGSIKAWFDDKGYGFIESPDLKKKYPDADVFLHAGQRQEFKKGAWVTFGVFMNNRGKPQATELKKYRFTVKKDAPAEPSKETKETTGTTEKDKDIEKEKEKEEPKKE